MRLVRDMALTRTPLIVSFSETAAFTETYGFAGSQGKVFLEGQLIRPQTPSDTVLQRLGFQGEA